MEFHDPIYYQLAGIIWKDIPMFSVITGLNGIGKSTFLKYIKENVADIMKSYSRTDQTTLGLFPNTVGIEISNNRFVEILLVADNSVIESNNKLLRTYQSVDSQNFFDNKISIKTFSDHGQLLFNLQNELYELSAFFEQKKFKYTRIEKVEGNDFVLSYKDMKPTNSNMSSNDIQFFKRLIYIPDH